MTYKLGMTSGKEIEISAADRDSIVKIMKTASAGGVRWALFELTGLATDSKPITILIDHIETFTQT